MRKLDIIKDDLPEMERFGELLSRSLTIAPVKHKIDPLKELLQTQEGDNVLSKSKVSDSALDADSDSDDDLIDVAPMVSVCDPPIFLCSRLMWYRISEKFLT